MKIKITEAQYSKIKVIAEQDEYLNNFNNFCAKKLDEINKIYSKVINLSVDEILRMELNIAQTIKVIENIEKEINNSERSIINLWDTERIKTDDENYDMKIYELSEKVNDKINSLTLILIPLAELQGYQSERKMTNMFGDVKPIEI
jgi:hypothetical protein